MTWRLNTQFLRPTQPKTNFTSRKLTSKFDYLTTVVRSRFGFEMQFGNEIRRVVPLRGFGGTDGRLATIIYKGGSVDDSRLCTFCLTATAYILSLFTDCFVTLISISFSISMIPVWFWRNNCSNNYRIYRNLIFNSI